MSEENNTDIVVWLTGFVKNFNLVPYDEKLYANILGYYNNSQIEFCIRRKKKNTSAATHRYYRGVILPIAKQSNMFGGTTIDNIHKYFVRKHLQDVVELQVNGMPVIIVTDLSTSEISQKRMNEFIEAVRQELLENNIETPDAIKEPSQNALKT